MGFLLFTESTVFNPINYGLQAGDNIFVVAVGGGGGAGGARYNSRNPYNVSHAATGGAGAASSFGEYVSAPGGAGGGGGVQNGSNYLTGGNYSKPGWFPWLESHPISDREPLISSWVPQQFLDQSVAHVTVGLSGFRFFNNNYTYNTYAPQQTYVFQQNTSSITRSTVTKVSKDYDEVPWAAFQVQMVNDYPCIQFRTLSKEIPTAGLGYCYYGGASGITFGSIGYGAGGTGSCVTAANNSFPYSLQGTTGSIVKKMITLADVSPIAVSVGGGGGSAGFEPVSSTSISSAKNGNAGSTSTQAPSNGNQYSGEGGYAGVNPKDYYGGGVCGCVAIWF